MIFKNNQQARKFLQDYIAWGVETKDEYFDRTRYATYFNGHKLIAEETLYLGKEYNTETRRLEPAVGTIVQYYFLPNGQKNKPMYSYRESLVNMITLIRVADKEG